ncbi:ATP-dependent DNA helicase PIF1-like [Olea europaea var. sylvestris]|uniref:ATP-dependent DNA helicase PIF1-like n=1 Tax=Olea europaea var. sylvestris TaxID=158386 RepID=UPI000C1D0D0C|nr:ATP-dependent DNA helicase PIF1-like [Olea europaea var. sylvestris]
MEKVKLESNGAFFIDGPGGTGKTFLYKALLSGVRFKIPLETIGEISCSVSKQSALGNLLNMSRLIIWDEAPMVNRSAVEATDKMLRDITNCNLLFGGKVVVLRGDFRQVLPVVRKGKKYDIMKASLVSSDLWPSFLHLPLTENMRAKLDPTFYSYLLRIGDGIEKEHTYIETYADDLQAMTNRVILTPTNECVDHINRILLEQIPGESYAYYSFDEKSHPVNIVENMFFCRGSLLYL